MYKQLSLLLSIIFLFLTEVHAEPFKVGVILPLSGPVAEYGDAVKNGFSIFQKDHPDSNLMLVLEDSRYDGPTSISVLNKLVDVDKVDLLFVWGAATSEILSPITEHRKIPTFIVTGNKDVLKNKNYSIAFSNEESEYANAQLEELRKRNLKKIAIVKTDIQYFENLLHGLKANLKTDESIEVIDSFQPGPNVNFQSTLTKLKVKLKSKKYDSLGVLLLNGQLNSFYRKLKEQNIKVFTFGSDVLGSSFERKESGPSIVGAVWSTLGSTNEFLEKYKSEFKKDDQIGYAAGAYDLANLLDNLFPETYKDNKKLSPEEILGRIESVKEREGASGKYYFTKDNPESDPVGGKRFKFPIVIKEVTKGGGERVIR